jgi:hypothetical protein
MFVDSDPYFDGMSEPKIVSPAGTADRGVVQYVMFQPIRPKSPAMNETPTISVALSLTSTLFFHHRF